MIVPTSLGLLYPSFPKRQHTLVVGLWAGVAPAAASAGPPVGGLLVSVDWRWIFLINLPLGVATVIAGAALLPEVRQPRGSRLPDAASALRPAPSRWACWCSPPSRVPCGAGRTYGPSRCSPPRRWPPR